MDFCQGRNSLAICDFQDFPVVKDFLCENYAVTAQWTSFKPLSSATPGEMQDGKYEKLAQWLSASARLNDLSYLALYSNKGETLVLVSAMPSNTAPKYAKYGQICIFSAYLGAPNMVKFGVPEKILQNAVKTRWS